MTEKKHIQSKEAQEALDSINKMQQAGLKRVLPTPIWLGAILGVLVGTQIALLGAEIRTYNTILIVLIIIMAIAIINKTQSAGATERIMLSKRTIIISLICIIPLYFLAIISGQYLNNHFGYNWAPVIIGSFFTIGIWSLMIGAYRSYDKRFNTSRS
ncbi:hypothetical protein OAC51_07880 [Flavobacteriaceae bacterium]|nr:hypothetical protein [Flavobacteriaceae bacterium]